MEAMADIYRSAYITLAAGASEDDEGGFFRVAEKIYSDPECVTVTEDGKKHKVYLRPFLSHPDQNLGGLSPLMNRGWGFQERIL